MDSVSPSATQRGQIVNQPSAIMAVRDLYERHYVHLVRLAVLLVGDVGRAEEIVQDAFVDLVARWRTIRDPGRRPLTFALVWRTELAPICGIVRWSIDKQ